MEISRRQGSEDQTVIFLLQDSFQTQHGLELTMGESVLDIVLSKYMNHWIALIIIKYILTSK